MFTTKAPVGLVSGEMKYCCQTYQRGRMPYLYLCKMNGKLTEWCLKFLLQVPKFYSLWPGHSLIPSHGPLSSNTYILEALVSSHSKEKSKPSSKSNKYPFIKLGEPTETSTTFGRWTLKLLVTFLCCSFVVFPHPVLFFIQFFSVENCS